MRIARSTLVGTAVAMALFGRNGAARADAPAADSADDSNNSVEEIVVHGYRASVRESLETKRQAIGVEEVITAEDVGKFPDKNLAEALQRVPGIVTQRDFGEGERINLRGTLTSLTNATFNGHSLSTADWFLLDQQSATRSFNYLMFPADLIGKVEVQKTAQADVQEGGIGGTVNIQTRKPLELDPFTAFASMEGAYTSTSKKYDPYGTVLASWHDKDNVIGVLVSGIYQERHIRRDGFEILGYAPMSATAAGSTDPNLVPTLINSALFQQDRIRKGGNFDVQYKPTDQLEFNLNGFLSIFDAENTNQSYLVDPQRAIANGGTLTNGVLDHGTYVSGTVASKAGGTQDFGVFYDSFHRIAKTTSHNIDLDTKYTPTDALTLHLDFGYTDATGKTDPQYFPEFGAPAAFSYDFTHGAPRVTMLPNANGTTVDWTNPNSFVFDFANDDVFINKDKEAYIYLDGEEKLDLGVLKSVKLGFKASNHERDASGDFTTYGDFFKPINTIPASAFYGGQAPSDFLSNIANSGSLTKAWIVDPAKAQAILSQQEAISGRVPYPQGGFTAQEKTQGGYVMANLGGDRWRGNAGVRIVHTDQITTGAVFVADPTQPGVIANPFGAYIPTAAERTYNDVLPSLNVAYDITNDIVARFAAAKVMSRPDFTDMVPRTTLNVGALTGSAGNPNIDPYRAKQADLSFEWYPNKDTAYSLAFYYKDIQSFIVDKPVAEVLPFTGQSAPSSACTTVGPNLFNCPFTVNVRSNGGGGKLKGVELGITQPIWGGFGLQANYTYSDATLDSGDPFPGNSKNTYNFTGFYENNLVSARLSWTQRSSFFLSFDRTSNLYETANTSLDAAGSVNVTKWLAVTFEAQNLTDAKIVQYADYLSHPRAIYDNGRVYFAGVKLRF
ncbi:MAG TPA: TonB-dependent receptor [Steroidobacteraceae bacterium]|nr:TonB-dependent receptor [Steroidobacteraceae bacterium]